MLEDRILVVDDDPSWQELLRECIETVDTGDIGLRSLRGLTVASSYAEADALLDRRHFHLAFVDLRLREDARELEGKKLARKISELDEGTAVVIATGHADVSTAITALREWKVLDFVLKDAWDPGKVAQLVQTGIPLARARYRTRYESAVEFLRGEQPVFPWIARTLQAVAPDTAVPRADRRLADFLNELLEELYPLLHDRAAPAVAFDPATGAARVRCWSKALGLPVSLRFGARASIEAESRTCNSSGFSRAERIVDDVGLGLRGVVHVPDAPAVDAFAPEPVQGGDQ
jgi:ActR/RegA family two-component response regulator